MKRLIRRAALLLAGLFICFHFGFQTYAATNTDKYYEIRNLKLSYDSTTGQVKANWNETEKSTDKVVMLYLDGISITEETVSGMYCDLTEYVDVAGIGSYTVTVYPVKLGSEYSKDSNSINITEKMLEKVRSFSPYEYKFDSAELKYDTKGSIIGTWNYGDKISGGKVQLYKGSTLINTWKGAVGNSYDFTNLIAKKGTGTYTFKVFPVKIGDQYAIVSDEMEVTSDMLKKLKVTVTTAQKNEEATRIGWYHNGPTNIWHYYKKPGVKATKEWMTINGIRYHFSSGGIMQIGWAAIDNCYYYFDPNGALVVNQIVDGYQLNESGQRLDESGNPASSKGEKEAPAVPSTLSTCAISVTESTKDGPGTVKNATFKEGSGFKIESVTMSSEYSAWTAGTPVAVKIVVTPTTNYSFDTNVKFTVRGCKNVTSAGSAKIRTVSFNYVPKKQLASPTNLYLNNTESIFWKKVDGASRYKVVITQDGAQKLSTNVNTTKCSISSYVDLTDENSVYAVKIYSMGAENTTSYLLTSPATVIEDLRIYAQTNTIDGELTWDSNGMKYVDGTGEKATGWKKLFDNWYYFKSTGYAVGPGWYQENELWYYFDNEYRMCTGYITEGDTTYFLNDGSVINLPLGAWVSK